MPDFDASVFFPAAKAAGMLAVATDDDGDFDVDFRRPQKIVGMDGNSVSIEFEIEYQVADRPNLREGTTLTLSGTAGDDGEYRVRKEAFVDAPGNAADGTYRCVLLTKIP